MTSVPIKKWQTLVLLTAFCSFGSAPASAQQSRAQVFSCVDASGRTLTSDRPIPQCSDREQRILDGVTGHQLSVFPPSYTDEERRAMAAKEREQEDARRKEREKRQRERVLLMRYPNEHAHNVARDVAKESASNVIAGAEARLAQIADERKALDAELGFYQDDMNKAPPNLKRQFEANEQEAIDQEKFIQGKKEERDRIDRQYDAELADLKRLWER